jgi:hypothetical protein
MYKGMLQGMGVLELVTTPWTKVNHISSSSFLVNHNSTKNSSVSNTMKTARASRRHTCSDYNSEGYQVPLLRHFGSSQQQNVNIPHEDDVSAKQNSYIKFF